MTACCPAMKVAGTMTPAAILEDIQRSGVPVHDTLRLAEFIDWFTSQTLAEAGAICSEEKPDKDRINQTFTDASLKLYAFCGRTFILQLLYSTAKNDFRTRVGKEEYDCIIGSVRYFHQELCRCDGGCHANVLDLGEILDLCVTRVKDEFEKYTDDTSTSHEKSVDVSSRNRRKQQTQDEGELEKPSEGAASKIKAEKTKSNLTKGNTTENYNYRSAYTMMVGLDSSIRLKDAMKIYRACMLGAGTFSGLVKAELMNQGFDIFSDAVTLKKFAEAQMASDAVLLCMSAITLKYDLPSAGSAFSRRHLLGDDENLWLEEYAPALFSECRKLFDITEDGYKRSVSRTGFSFIEFASNSKSGEMFFFSWDGKYIIKTISEKEVYVMIKMLPKYVLHVAKPSLLMRICGLYRVSVSSDYPPRYFLIAISVFDAGDMGLHHQYDLKGSTSGRMAAPTDSVQKDLNWIDQGTQVCLPAGLKRTIAAALENDANFLKDQSVLDYSVLVGIHDRETLEAGKQNKGVRLLQGIVKQKLMPFVKTLKTIRAQSFELSSKEPDPACPGATRSSARRHSEPVLNGKHDRRGNSSPADMEWLNSTSRNTPSVLQNGTSVAPFSQACGQTTIGANPLNRIGALSTSGVTNGSGSPSISRLPSCTSDPFEDSEIDDGDDLFSVTGVDEGEWQAVRDWLPHLEASSDPPQASLSNGITVECDGAGRCDSGVDTLVKELDALAHLGRFGPSHSRLESFSVNPLTSNCSDKDMAVEVGGGFVPLQLHPPPPASALAVSSAPTVVRQEERRQKMSSLMDNSEMSGISEPVRCSPLPGSARQLQKAQSMVSTVSAAGTGIQSTVRKSVKTKKVDAGKQLHVFQDPTSGTGWKGMHGPISSGNVRGEFGRYVYFIGIIDFLIPWDSRKKAEFAWNCMRMRGASASCVPPPIYAKRQTDFVLQKMMGLFDLRTAAQYSSATVTIPPPKFLQRPEDAEDVEGGAAEQQEKKALPAFLAKLRSAAIMTEGANQQLPSATKACSHVVHPSCATALATPSEHGLQESAEKTTSTVLSNNDFDVICPSAPHRSTDWDMQSSESTNEQEHKLIASLENLNREKQRKRSPVRGRRAAQTSSEKPSSTFGDAVPVPGGPERGGPDPAGLYDIDEDDDGGVADEDKWLQGHRSAPPPTPAQSRQARVKKREQDNYVSRLKQAQDDTESLSSQVSALMASVEQAKQNASIVMVSNLPDR